MAPIKGIRTYSNKNRKPASKLALDKLLASNISKRLEISITSPGTSKDKSAETTFDRLLKGPVYNEVALRKFPQNSSYSNINSINSVFSRTDDSFIGNNTTNQNSSLGKSLLSPVVILERNLENYSSPKSEKTEKQLQLKPVEESDCVASNYSNNASYSEKTDNLEDCNAVQNSQKVNFVISRLQNRQKVILLRTLHLCETGNESNYFNFRNSVASVSTPENRNKKYSLRKFGKRESINQDLSHDFQRLQSQIDDLSNKSIQDKESNLVDMNIASSSTQMGDTKENDTLAENFKESPRSRSTPLPDNNYSFQNLASTSLLSESLKIVNEWSNRCPTPNSFKTTPQKNVEPRSVSLASEYLHKRKRDTKLFKKSRVILKYNPYLENIIRNDFENMKSHDMTFLSVKRISDKFVTRRNKKSSRENTTELKNCAVYLTPLKVEKLFTCSEVKNISSEQSLLEISEQNIPHRGAATPKTSSVRLSSIGSQRRKQKKSRIKYNHSIEIVDENVSGKVKHNCSENCEHFRKIPVVVLERCDFSEKMKNHNYSDMNKTTDSSISNGSQNEFKGFDVSVDLADHAEPVFQMNKISSRKLPRRHSELPAEEECSDKKKFCRFKKRECYVILDEMVSNENKIPSTPRKSEPTIKLRDCMVTLDNIEEGKKSTSSKSCASVNSRQENSRVSNLCEPKTTLNSSDDNCFPSVHNMSDESVMFIEPLRNREFVTLAPGKKFRRSVAVFKKTLDDLENNSSIRRTTFCRRQSVKLISVVPNKSKTSELASFAIDNSGYVSLRQSFRPSSLEKVENYLPNVRPLENYLNYITNKTADQLTARDIVLKRCGQTEPLQFEKCYPTRALQNCQKIGEGVFGEVFMIRDKDGSTTVMKVIPIEGEQIVNLEKQKTFEEIISEIIISMELSNLERTKRNNTDAFVKVKGIRCVKGCYPDRLLELWELYDENKQSENDSPEIFLENQLYIVIELANAGKDLEAFEFSNAQQALAVFEQITCALAVAESELQFEHRDLHWGNVLITPTEKKNTVFVLDGKEIIVNNRGTKATIIDFTLSRVEYEGVIIFNDLSMDVDLFTAKGDYQFDIYRKMQENNGNQWQNFKPYSNILWLHYILDKALKGFRYKNKKSKLHKTALSCLKAYEQRILESNSATDFVLNNFISNTLIE